MEEKNQENQEFQDIILENDDENSGGKAKKVITTIISLIILFLIIVIVVKFLNTNDEEEPMLSQNTAGALILPDEPIAPMPMPESFEQMPIVTEPTMPSMPVTTAPELKDEPRAELITPAPKEPEVKKPEPEAKKPESKKPEPATKPEPKKPEPKKPEASVIKPEPKKPALEKALTKPEPTTNTASSAMAGSYVQVASVAKLDPKSSLIKKLSSAGYEYKTYETTVNGKKVTKLLIGPFSGAELNQKLAQIRADIDQNAYIYKIK